MRRLALLPLIPAVLLAVTGCNPEHAGAAATVGSHRLDLGDFMDATEQGFAHYTGTTDVSTGAAAGKGTQADFQRTVLTREIRAVLIDDAAQQLGVHVSSTDVQQQIVQIDQQLGSHKALLADAATKGFSAAALPQEIRSEVLTTAISAKLLQAHPVTEQAVQAYYAANSAQFASDHVAHILVKDKALADSIFAQVKADPSKFAALAKQYSIDTGSKDNGGDLGTQAKGAFVQPFEDAVFAAHSGDIIGPVQSQFGYHIIHVISVTSQTLAQARPAIESTLSAPQSTYVLGLFGSELASVARKAKVHVSSRFGVWDSASVSVVAAGSNPKTALSVTGRTDTVTAPPGGATTSTIPAP